MKKYLYTDIDGVLSLGQEIKYYQTKWRFLQKFNPGAVKVYNEILEKTGAEIVISSSWKWEFELKQLQEIFTQWARISKEPIDITPEVFMPSLQYEQRCRAKEILLHVKENNVDSWVAIDDLDLRPFLPSENFVWLPKFYEGVKQTGKKEEIIKKLNVND